MVDAFELELTAAEQEDVVIYQLVLTRSLAVHEDSVCSAEITQREIDR
jgi:hypothetical protein